MAVFCKNPENGQIVEFDLPECPAGFIPQESLCVDPAGNVSQAESTDVGPICPPGTQPFFRDQVIGTGNEDFPLILVLVLLGFLILREI